MYPSYVPDTTTVIDAFLHQSGYYSLPSFRMTSVSYPATPFLKNIVGSRPGLNVVSELMVLQHIKTAGPLSVDVRGSFDYHGALISTRFSLSVTTNGIAGPDSSQLIAALDSCSINEDSLGFRLQVGMDTEHASIINFGTHMNIDGWVKINGPLRAYRRDYSIYIRNGIIQPTYRQYLNTIASIGDDPINSYILGVLGFGSDSIITLTNNPASWQFASQIGKYNRSPDVTSLEIKNGHIIDYGEIFGISDLLRARELRSIGLNHERGFSLYIRSKVIAVNLLDVNWGPFHSRSVNAQYDRATGKWKVSGTGCIGLYIFCRRNLFELVIASILTISVAYLFRLQIYSMIISLRSLYNRRRLAWLFIISLVMIMFALILIALGGPHSPRSPILEGVAKLIFAPSIILVTMMNPILSMLPEPIRIILFVFACLASPIFYLILIEVAYRGFGSWRKHQ